MTVEVKGRQVQIDDEDAHFLEMYRWYVGKNGYVVTKPGKNCFYLHRLIMGNRGEHIDHADGDKLNNRKSNLRPCTCSQNLLNSKKPKTNTSGYKGVCRDKVNKKWQVQIGIRGKLIFLGRYNDIQEAAEAYRRAAIKYAGEFARFE